MAQAEMMPIVEPLVAEVRKASEERGQAWSLRVARMSEFNHEDWRKSAEPRWQWDDWSI